MKKEDKTLAEAILKHLCIGRRICGINFYAVPVLLIDAVDKPQLETTIQLGENSPHLVLKFENGQFLHINGHHDQYESWNILAGEYQVVATPGDGLAIWHPEEFSAKYT